MSKLDPRFEPGDFVYVQLGVHPQLYSEDVGSKREPKKVMIRGVVFTCQFSHGYDQRSRPVPGTEAIEYLTSYSERTLSQDSLFASVKEFNERRADEIREHKEAREREAREKRLKEYRAAKRLVTEFEADIIEGLAE